MSLPPLSPRRRQNVVRLDSDENASTAVIILTDLYKMFPQQLATQSRAFIDTSIERFRSLQPLVAQAFGGDRVCRVAEWDCVRARVCVCVDQWAGLRVGGGSEESQT